MQAVILAAGMGSRIRDLHALPKGFIALSKNTIIEESIRSLHYFGIDDIVIITGFAASYYEALSEKQKTFRTLFNPNYHCFNSLYSLYCAKELITQDFLLLESDIIYENRAIEKILSDKHQDVILLSGETQSGDEVYVESKNQNLIRMSKQKNQLSVDQIYGEFVGINKLSLESYQFLMDECAHNQHLLETGCYDEQGLVSITQRNAVHCLKIPDLLWSEIDNAFQLERAKRLYPEICRRKETVIAT